MDLWLVESHTAGYNVNWKIKRMLHREKTPFQELAIVETEELGKALVLDGVIQVTEADEFIYHEMLTHVPLYTHPDPKQVLIIGGGDGGTMREALKHPGVQVDLVEIDRQVIEATRKYMPELNSPFDSPRVNIIIDDGIEYVRSCRKKYDAVLIDSSDPVGPAVGLFRRDFYQQVYQILNEDGLMAAQTESPFFNRVLLREIYQSLCEIFPITMVYLTAMPSYIAGFWSFTLASKKYHPLENIRLPVSESNYRYYTPQIHRAAFVLPPFIEQALR